MDPAIILQARLHLPGDKKIKRFINIAYSDNSFRHCRNLSTISEAVFYYGHANLLSVNTFHNGIVLLLSFQNELI